MDFRVAHEILDTAHNAVVSMDEAGRIAYWNPAAEAMFEIARETAIGQPLADTIIPLRHRDAHWSGLQRFLQTGEASVLGQRMELTALRRDGTEFPVEITISAQRDEEAWSFHAFIQDISARKEIEAGQESRLAQLETSLAGSEQRFEAVLDALGEAVTIRNRDDRIIYANRAGLLQLGFASIEELRTAEPKAIMHEFLVEDEHGRPLTMDDVPSVRIFRGELPDPVVMHTLHHQTGDEQWLLLKASPLLDAAGQIEATVTVIEDVTGAKRAELRAGFLARASQVLGASLDYQRTLRNVANLAVPEVADWCVVDLVDEQARREQVVVAHADPGNFALAERIRHVTPQPLDPERGLGRVIATGQPEVKTYAPGEPVVSAAGSDERLRLLEDVGMRSLIMAPMSAGGRTLGVMTLVSAESGRRFGALDLELALQIAQRAAVAVENARLYSEREQIAATLQRSLLPEALPAIDGWDVAALYRPAGGGMEVGGDFYDVFPAGDAWIVLIGDVTGKGVEAAAMTSLVRHSARIVAEDDPRPSAILRRLDRVLRGQESLSLCTALCLRLEDGAVTLSVGGHPLPLLISETGIVEAGRPGTLLGAFDDREWHDDAVDLRAGDTLLLFTDGITDTVGEQDRFGDRRLHALARRCAGQHPSELLACLDEGLNEFQVGSQADDTAALALRLSPVREATTGSAAHRRQQGRT